MNLDKVVANVEGFINLSKRSTKDFLTTREDFTDKVSAGRMGTVEADEKLKAMKSVIGDKLEAEYKPLIDGIQTTLEHEYSNIDNSSESVTADQLAELTLLGELDLTNDDIEKYADKYKRNPLALKKLKNLAEAKNLYVEFPLDRKTFIHTALGRAETKVMEYARPNYDKSNLLISLDWLADGAIESIKQDIAVYKTL